MGANTKHNRGHKYGSTIICPPSVPLAPSDSHHSSSLHFPPPRILPPLALSPLPSTLLPHSCILRHSTLLPQSEQKHHRGCPQTAQEPGSSNTSGEMPPKELRAKTSFFPHPFPPSASAWLHTRTCRRNRLLENVVVAASRIAPNATTRRTTTVSF